MLHIQCVGYDAAGEFWGKVGKDGERWGKIGNFGESRGKMGKVAIEHMFYLSMRTHACGERFYAMLKLINIVYHATKVFDRFDARDIV